MAVTILHFEPHTPTDEEFSSCPHIVLTSSQAWDPASVTFPQNSRTLEEEVGGFRYVGAISSASTFIDVNGIDPERNI